MELLAYFRNFHYISEATYALLTEHLRVKSFKKGDIIIKPGQIQKELYFVKSGVQMSYFNGIEKTHVIAFTYFPNLCAIPDSFSLQQPSTYFLSCITDSELGYLTYAQLQELYPYTHMIFSLIRLYINVFT